MPRLFEQNLDIIAGDVVRTVPIQMMRTAQPTDFQSLEDFLSLTGRPNTSQFTSSLDSL